MRQSSQDFYNPVSDGMFVKSFIDSYWLPINENRTVLVVSTSAEARGYLVVAYTVLVTLIFMAACELVTLVVLTWFTVRDSGTRQAMLVTYYNAGSPSRTLPLMLGYIYNGLFRCKRGEKRAVDWKAVRAGFLLFILAFGLLSSDMLTKFFLGGKALNQGNAAPANANAVYYPDFEGSADQDVRDALKGPRAPAVFQAIARRSSTRREKLHSPSNIAYEEHVTKLQNGNSSRRYTYGYKISGYQLGLRDAPGLMYEVKGQCETAYNNRSVNTTPPFSVTPGSRPETMDVYPFWDDETGNRRSTGSAQVPLERENYTAPWVFYHQAAPGDEVWRKELEVDGYAFQLVPHTAYRVSSSENTEDPWYRTEPNPAFLPSRDENASQSYLAQYRVRAQRPPLRCTQNDTYSYEGAKVTHIDNLRQLPGLKVSNFTEFVLKREFGSVPVIAAILSMVPFGSLRSGVHFISNQRRLDAQRASMSNDFRELIEISYVYSREVIRNTVLLFPSQQLEQDLGTAITGKIVNAVETLSKKSSFNGVDFIIDSQEVAALSVITLVATPVVCIALWIIVLGWTLAFSYLSKLDNDSRSGRHNLRRAALPAVHIYRALDEAISEKRKWSGRNTNTPFVSELSPNPSANDAHSGSTHHESDKALLENTAEDTKDVKSGFPKPRLVIVEKPVPPPVPPPAGNQQTVQPPASGDIEQVVQQPVIGDIEQAIPQDHQAGQPAARDDPESVGVWGWVKIHIFRMTRKPEPEVVYEIKWTREWDKDVPPVRRTDILDDVV